MQERPNPRLKIGRLHARIVGALALLLLTGAAAKEKPKPVPQMFEGGTCRVELALAPNWSAIPHRESDCIVFQFVDEPAESVSVTLGVFRLVVPPAARGGDRIQLGAAYAILDAAGAQTVLFHASTKLALESKTPRALNDGQLFSYAEPDDLSGNRTGSTKFFRAWVFFPASYPAKGALYLVFAKEQAKDLEPRPSELDLAEEIIAGIREP